MKPRHLILYDFLLVKGGAEACTLTLCDALDNLDLCVGFVDHNCFSDKPVMSGSLCELTTVSKLPGWLYIKVARAFTGRKACFIDDYDKVIFSGSTGPLAVKHRTKKGNLLYCHTPPRFIYDLKSHYLSTIPWWQRPILRMLIAYLQPKFESAIEDMDVIIANSINVQGRIKRYFNKNAIVIYPPCDIDRFRWLGQGDYYLSTARVEPYKRIRLIVEAFKQMPQKQLVVASGGSQLVQLQALAQGADNIRFTGWCDVEQLQSLMGNCIATVYLPMDEDFGISPVESMAAGKPVIGVDEGGVKETVVAGQTGVLCPANPTVTDIIQAVNLLTPEVAMSYKTDCCARAQQFSADIFITKMEKLLAAQTKDLGTIAKIVDASS